MFGSGLQEVEAGSLAGALAGLVSTVEEVLAGFDPVGVAVPEVEEVWTALDRVERLVAGAKLRLAGRLDEAGGWRRAGRRSVADHLAALSGSSVGQARGVLEASRRLAELPVVADAVSSGSLSLSQACLVTDAAAAAPHAQGMLVGAAGRESLSELRERCGRTKVAADRDADARHARIHAGRFLRRRSCSDGAAELTYRSTPEEVAEVFAVTERLADRLFRHAHREGRTESAEAHLADGLLLMARRAAAGTAESVCAELAAGGPAGWASAADVSRSVHGGTPTDQTSRSSPEPTLPFDLPPGTVVATEPIDAGISRGSPGGLDGVAGGRVVPKEVIVRIDWDALVRGWPIDGEVCEIAGVGAVPVSVVRGMLDTGDAVLKAVVTKGVDVVSVTHLGRGPTAFQTTALRWLDLVCAEVGCGQRAHLEIDHTIPWVTSRITLLELLEPRCRHHHRVKTRRDMAELAAARDRPEGVPSRGATPTAGPSRAGPVPPDRAGSAAGRGRGGVTR